MSRCAGTPSRTFKMRYLALACDYDGTIAHHGRVSSTTVAALERLRASGRKPLLVTGRELGDLLSVFPRVDLFDRMVLENGALLYRPATKQERRLAEPPPPEFVRELARRGVAPVSVGRSIVATWHPHETTVLEVIRDLGLELQVIFNKGAVMVLPPGVTKATGLIVALDELGLSPRNVVGVGDAENDHAFLSVCEFSAAVANALPSVKERADLVTRGDHGTGVEQLIDELLACDLARPDLPLGMPRSASHGH
jgi:HAD superfamily hydrolase (TIGR01484 family)